MSLSLNRAYKALKVLDKDGDIEAGAILQITGDNITTLDYTLYSSTSQFHPTIRRYEDSKLINGEWSISDYVDYRNAVMSETIDKIWLLYKTETIVIISSLVREEQLNLEREKKLW